MWTGYCDAVYDKMERGFARGGAPPTAGRHRASRGERLTSAEAQELADILGLRHPARRQDLSVYGARAERSEAQCRAEHEGARQRQRSRVRAIGTPDAATRSGTAASTHRLAEEMTPPRKTSNSMTSGGAPAAVAASCSRGCGIAT